MNDERLAEGPITEDWLRKIGFKWEQLDRQPTKHWLLWIGDALVPAASEAGASLSSNDDLGIELAHCGHDRQSWWHCWLRCDFWGRYARFIHVRHMERRSEVITLIEALTGRRFDPADVLYGSLRSPDQAARLRRDAERLDRRIAAEQLAAELRRSERDPDQRGLLR